MWKPQISSYRLGYRADDKNIVYDICHLANAIVLRNVASVLVSVAPGKLIMTCIFLYLSLLILSYFEQRGCDISHCSADIRCKMSWDIWTLPVPLLKFTLSAILNGLLMPISLRDLPSSIWMIFVHLLHEYRFLLYFHVSVSPYGAAHWRVLWESNPYTEH